MGEHADAVRADCATALERLGSDRALIALTDADLSGETIRRRIAETDLGAASVLESWQGFDETAESKRGHADRIAEPLSNPLEPPSDDPIAGHLQTCETPAERVGAGLIGYPLIVDGWYLQAVSFFVNEAEESAADEFRSVRSETRAVLEAGEERIGELDDPEAARVGAGTLVDAVYEWYVETLAGMGLDPKTVC